MFLIQNLVPTLSIDKIRSTLSYSSLSMRKNGMEWDKGRNMLLKKTHGVYNMFQESNYWAPSDVKSESYVILDMNRETVVRYISVMGRPPRVRNFPNRIQDKGYSCLEYENRIPVLMENFDEYVTKFALYGRMEKSKWIHIGTYTGNNNTHTEVLIDISSDIPDGFSFRYLKVAPLTYVGNKSMRFCLYGNVDDADDSTKDNKTTVIEYSITSQQKDRLQTRWL